MIHLHFFLQSYLVAAKISVMATLTDTGVGEPTIVVIRPFRPQDNHEVQALIRESTMSTVRSFFIQALMREIYFQSIIMTAAIMFIFVGVPFYWTVSAIALVTVVFYLVIIGAHSYRARYHTGDLQDILSTYLSSNKTCFFVAEAFGSPPPKRSSDPGISRIATYFSSIAFINITEFEKLDRNGGISASGRKRELIGTIGITRDRNSAVIAWVRRMGVKKTWQGRGVGSHLIDTVIKFCNTRSFVAIELVTTECHDSAKTLLERKGFETRQLYHKKYIFLNSLAIGMQFMTYKTRSTYRGGTAVDL